MSKFTYPETLNDLIKETQETMRVSGVPYPVRARDKQVGGKHYKRMGIEPWDVIDTWPKQQRIGAYRAGGLKYIMRMGTKDEAPQEIGKGKHYLEKLLEVLNERIATEGSGPSSSRSKKSKRKATRDMRKRKGK